MNYVSIRTLSIAAAIMLAALASPASRATAQLAAPGQFEPPCRGTWWIEPGELAYGEKLPQFGFSKCDGEEQSTSDLEGKPLLLNFWAMWCAPCRDELPNLDELAMEAGDSLAVIGVSLDTDPAQLHKFVEQAKLHYDITWDGGGIARDLGVRSIPVTLAIDAEGNLVGAHQGYASKDQLEKLAELAGADLPDDKDE